MTESSPSPFSLGFCSNPWYHTPTPNRIPLIPTLGCKAKWSHIANWKPWEEIHIGIQTPEHLAKPNPAGLCMWRWPPLEPQPISLSQWPRPPSPWQTLSLPTHLFHTDVQTRTSLPYVLLPLDGFYFSNHVLKLNHQVVGMSCACVSHRAWTHSTENKLGQESSQVCTKNKLDN